jgi:hypothetical protein
MIRPDSRFDINYKEKLDLVLFFATHQSPPVCD